MQRWWLVILVGVVCYFVGSWRSRVTAPPAEAETETVTTTQAEAPKPAVVKPAPRTVVAPVLGSVAAIELQRQKAAPRKAGDAFYIAVDDDTLEKLQAHWEQLPREAYTTPSPGGWKIHFLSRENVFDELGLIDGDFIPRDQYDVTSGDPRVTAINRKLLAALKRIERD